MSGMRVLDLGVCDKVVLRGLSLEFEGLLLPALEYEERLVDADMELVGGLVFYPEGVDVVGWLDGRGVGYVCMGAVSGGQIDRMLSALESKKVDYVVGERVRVLVGRWRNLCGDVVSIEGGGVRVSRRCFRGVRDLGVFDSRVLERVVGVDDEVKRVDHMEGSDSAVVVDAHSVLFGCMRVGDRLRRVGDGVYVGAAHGFYFTLLKLKMLYPESCVHVVFDGCVDLRGYDRCVGGGVVLTESGWVDMGYNLELSRRLVKALGFPCYGVEGVCGGELLRGLVVSLCGVLGGAVRVYANDEGLYGMAGGRVSVLRPKSGLRKGMVELCGVEGVEVGGVEGVEVGGVGVLDEVGLRGVLGELCLGGELDRFGGVSRVFRGVWS